MNVEIISVGTELLMGEIVNTNAVSLMQFCKELGFNVYYQSTVGDNPQRLKETIQLAFKRGADIVMTTGGIGPTNDDLTKQISAEVFDLPLEYRIEEAKKIEAKVSFLTNTKEIAKSNYQQAYYAKGAYILENDVGTANGCILEKNGKRIINLPGPPREMNYIVSHALKPYFSSVNQSKLYTREFVVFKTGESQLADELSSLFEEQKDVTLALYAQEGYVRIRLAYRSDSQTDAIHHLAQWQHKLEWILMGRLLPVSILETLWIHDLPDFSLDLGDCAFLSDFFYKEYFADHINQKSKNHLVLKLRQETLGEIMTVWADFYDRQASIEIPSLKAAIYSLHKNKQKILDFLRQFVKEENSDCYDKL